MKKLLSLLLLLFVTIHGAEHTEQAKGTIMQNLVGGYSGGYNLEITKISNDNPVSRIISYQETAIIALPDETIEKLEVSIYGEKVKAWGIPKLLVTNAPNGFSVNASYNLVGLPKRLSLDRKEFSVEELLPITLKDNPKLLKLFKTQDLTEAQGLWEIIGKLANQKVITDKEVKKYKEFFPGLLHRGLGRSQITNLDFARYVLGIADSTPEHQVYLEDLEYAYQFSKYKWEQISDYYEQSEPIAYTNCQTLLTFLDKAYNLLKNSNKYLPRLQSQTRSPLDVPENADYDKALSILEIQRPATAYDVLGIEEGATQVDIRDAYKSIVKLWHPNNLAESSEIVFPLIQWAYEALIPKPAQEQIPAEE